MNENQKPPTASPEPAAPQVLQAQSSVAATSSASGTSGSNYSSVVATPLANKRKRLSYRPSHKATFIGLAVVAIILGVNAVIISIVMRNQADAQDAAVRNGVTISGETLNKLGVSRNPVGNAETELVVGPNSLFNGKVRMAGDLAVAGQLNLNGAFTASEARFTKLQAGEVAVEGLNINGEATVSTLNIRQDLQVAGTTRIQGQLSVNQLTTINNNLNVAGNLAVGGSLSVRDFQVSTLTVSGHLLSSGSTPSVSPGGGVGSNGTVSIGGNDTAGTVAVNTGVGASGGVLANVSFATKYGTTPHVIVTAVGRSVEGLYINRSANGFSINAGALAPGGYAFDYIVVQ